MNPRIVLLIGLIVAAAVAWPATPRDSGAARPEGIAFSITSGTPPDTATRGTPFMVPLSVTNTGTMPWEPDQNLYFSYRWRTFFGDELGYESERTAFPTPVPPGGHTRVNARVEPPGVPGVYILEWALVWEHHGWIPRDSAKPRVVTILPAGYDLATAAVFVLALASFSGFRRTGRLRWWVAGAILTRPLILVADSDLTITPTAILVTAALAGGLIAAGQALPKRYRLLCGWIAVLAATTVVLADVAHLRYFGDVPTLASLGNVGRALVLFPSTAAVLTGWHLLPMLELLLTLPAVVSSVRATDPERGASSAAKKLGGLPLRTTTTVVALIAAGSVVVTLALHARADVQVFKNLYAVQDLGIYGYHVRDVYAAWFERSRDIAPRESVVAVNNWVRRAHATVPPPGDAFGKAAGKNVVVVQVESLQTFVVGLSVNGREITPTLNRLRRDALWFPHIHDQTNEGRTSDAEFAALTSLLPARHGATAFSYATNTHVALPAILTRHGYTTLAAVPFDASFWNRSTVWPAYGFSQTMFDMDFQPGAMIGWGLNDQDFLRQMAHRLSTTREPFLAWLVTLSLHHPFDSFPDEFRKLDLGVWNRTALGNYLEAMHLFDTSVNGFLEDLRESKLLDRTMVVVFGDHDANLPKDGRVAAALGIENRAESWDAADRIPLFILGASGATGEVATLGGHTDVAPTVLGLLGIDPSRFAFMGRDLLNNPEDRPVVRPYGGWVNTEHLFVPSSDGSVNSSGRCFSRTTLKPVPMDHCKGGVAAATEQRRVADTILTYDLQSTLALPSQRASAKTRSSRMTSDVQPGRARRH
jgi:phosphoglycerol transferase MdoB-like AlkP superfamily enzyme